MEKRNAFVEDSAEGDLEEAEGMPPTAWESGVCVGAVRCADRLRRHSDPSCRANGSAAAIAAACLNPPQADE